MASLKILHASDLHICQWANIRSPLDAFKDLKDPSSFSWEGFRTKFTTFLQIRSDLRKRMASSYQPEPLLALAQFAYRNARRKVRGENEEIEESGDKLDAVILTGDLATTGEIEDIERTALFLRAKHDPTLPYRAAEATYREATLSALRIPIIVLPGNHDRYLENPSGWLDQRPIIFNPAGKNFDKFIQDYSDPNNLVFMKALPVPITSKTNLVVVFLCADFSLQDITHYDKEARWGWLAQGGVYPAIREELVEKTIKVKQQTSDSDVLCVFWAIHFPPFFPGVKKHSQLLGEDSLVQAANRLGVQGILAGHTHQQLQYQTPGMHFQGFCCGTTTQHEPTALHGGHQHHNVRAGNHFQILTVTADPTCGVSIAVQHYRYSGTTDDDPSINSWTET